MAEPITPRRTDNVWQFKRVASGRPSDEIVAQIRARLSSQVVRVGDKLPSERELEQQFQVSRNSIRQALKSLANMGLLEMRKGVSGGAFVISGDGVIQSAGTYLSPPADVRVDLVSGLGARHRAGAAMSKATKAVVIVLSQSTGRVTIYRQGREIMAVSPARARIEFRNKES